jgi:hypothetical protein
MNKPHFDSVAQIMTSFPSRRNVLRGLAGAGLGLGFARLPDLVEAKKKHKRKKRRRKNRGRTGPLCTSLGEPCSTPGTQCQERFCLQAPLTIAAIWQKSGANHDTWLFVPPRDGATSPSPQIDYDCNQSNSPCAEAYPFACVSRDAQGPGDEVTTIFERLPGSYEYWMVLEVAPADELTVVLTNRDGRVVRTWSSPAVTSPLNGAWHVFDLDGETGRVRSVDAPLGRLPNPVTNVCPE